MAESIGLRAVLELSSFSKAVASYQSSIAGMSKNTASTASSISSSFVSAGSGILKLGAIAGGVALAGVAGLTAGLVLLGSTALKEFARFERASLSIQSLVARELSQGQLVEQQRTVAIGLTKKEAQELDGLADKIHKQELARNTLHARIKEQSEALRQLRDAHGDDALNVQTATARLAELESKYNESGAAIEKLKNRQVELSDTGGRYATVIDKVRTGQISMNEAMEQAGPRAAELITWISKLAVLSPFTEAGIQDAFQTALAYGFTTEAAQRLTEAEVDFAAATGKNVEVTNLIALALGQMQAKGKVSGQELIQLTNAGIGVNKILEGMGFTLDDVSNGLVDADTFIEAVIQDMEIFKGAGAAQAQTFSGLISTLSDLKAIGLREFFTGTFTAIQPYLTTFVDGLVSATLETGRIRELGDTIGVYVAAGLQKVTTFVTKLTGAFSRFGVRGVGVSLLGQLGLDPTQIAGIMGVVDQITGAISRIQGAYERFGLKGAAVSILGMLGMDPQTIGTIRTTIDNISTAITEAFSKIQGAYSRFGFKGAAVSILGMLGMDPETIGSIRTTFDTLASAVTDGFTRIKDAYNIFGVQGGAFTLLSVLGVSPETLIFLDKNLTSIVDTLTEKFNAIKTAFDTFGARGAAFSILGMLGLDSDTMVTLNNAINTIVETVSNISFDEIVGAFTGIGAVLAGGALAGLIVGLGTAIAGILTPINLLIAGAALLGAAWAGNWGGIQEIAGQALATLTTVFTTLSAVVMSVANTFMTTVWPQLQQAFGNINQGLSNLGLTWGDVFNALLTSTGIVIGGIISIVVGLVSAFATSFNTATQIFANLSAAITQIITGVVQQFVGIGQVLQGIFTGNLTQIGQGLTLMAQSFINIISGLAQASLAIISAPFALILSNITGFVSGAIAMFQGLYDAVVGNSIVPDLVNDVVGWFKKLPQMTLSALANLSTTLSKPFKDAWDAINEAINIEGWQQLGIDAIEGLLEGMKERAGDVLEFIKNLAADSLKGLGQFWGARSPATEFIPLGMSVPQGVAKGVNNAAHLATQAVQNMGQNLLAQSSGFADSFIESLDIGSAVRARGPAAHLGRDIRDALKFGIRQFIPQLADGATMADVNAMVAQVGAQWGKSFSQISAFVDVEAIYNEIKDKFGVAWKQFRIENLGNLTQMAGSFSSLGSTFAEMLQAQMGSTEAANKTVEAYKKLGEVVDTDQNKLTKLKEELTVLTTSEGSHQIAIDKKTLAVEKMTESIEFNKRQLAIYEQEIAGMELGTLAWEKKQLQIDKTTESIDAQEKQLITLSQELEKLSTANNADTLAIEKKRLEIEKLTQEMAKNQQAVIAARKDFEALATGSAADRIAFLQSFLESGEESIRLIGEELGGIFAGTGLTADVYWTRVAAQEELNRLLEEQRQQEELITRQKEAQQKLDFLRSQLDLIKLGQGLGGDIFQGITFGLNASVEDLLAATNNIVEAMVEQINSDLQLGSPSRLMINTFKQVMAGAAIGMERGQSLLSDAVRSIPILNGTIPQPVFSQPGGAGSGGGTVYNYNFPMTVNTPASAQAVIRQYEIKRSMYAN